jgi:CHRD domain-containing protein
VIDENTSTIQFELTYVGLTAPATVAHIHFGNRFTSGGVSVFLCGGGGRPACPPGTAVLATVTGTITASDVIGPTAQGIAPNEIDELIRAIHAGVTYVNVHNANFPQGEIRGQVNDDNQRQP